MRASSTEPNHFAIRYRLDAQDSYLIWTSREGERVVVDARGQVPRFSNPTALRAFAHARGIALVDEEPRHHDLDKTVAWLSADADARIDCDNLLAAWNLFGDVSRSVDGNFSPGPVAAPKIYEKLFFGGATANTVLRPEQEPRYEPSWSAAEIAALRETLARGLRVFRESVSRRD
jgi:hypothetical protein